MRKVLILFVVLTSLVYSSQQKHKYGIALCGGGALGFAHIGALQVIDSLGIPIDYVAGTSMGGLVGALYSMGYSPDEMENMVESIDWQEVFSDKPKRKFLPYLVKRNTGRYQLEFEFNKLKPSLPSGIIKGQKISLLFSQLTYPFEQIESFNDLPISFKCVGVDLVSGKEVVFADGSLAKAMRATMSIPSAFDPIKIDNKLIIDGGVINNFPVDVVKEMGADRVIGLNITFADKPIAYYDNLFKVLDRTSDLPRYARLKENIDNSDVYIEEYLEGFSFADFSRENIPAIIAQGKKAVYAKIDELLQIKKEIEKEEAVSKLPEIKNIIVQGNYYLSSRQVKQIFSVKENDKFDEAVTREKISNYNSSPLLDSIYYKIKKLDNNKINLKLVVEENLQPLINNIKVLGLHNIERQLVVGNMGIKRGEKFDIEKLETKINYLYGLGYFNTIRYEISKAGRGKVNINLEVSEKSFQKLVTGFMYNDYYKLVGLLGFHSNSLFIKGFHIEAEMMFSGYTKFNFNIFYPSRTFSLPIYPYAYINYNRVPREVYNREGINAINYDDKFWQYGFGIGISPSNYFNLQGSLFIEKPDIEVILQNNIDSSEKVEVKKSIVGGSADLVIDLLDDVLLPTDGFKLTSHGEVSFKSLGSEYYYEKFDASIDIYKSLGKRHTVRLMGTTKRAWHADPFYKTLYFLGGPDSFVGIHYYQAVGNMFNIARAEYRFKLAENLFVKAIANTTFGYTLGTVDDPTTGKELFGFGLSFKYMSFLGPIEITFARGDKNVFSVGEKNNLVYFVMGYKF